MDGVYISSYAANGGNYGGAGGNTADRAFDGNFSTFWETGKPNSQNFVNDFTVTFSGTAQIDRIIYATRQDAYAGRGYPSVLTVYVSDEAEGENFREICEFSSSNGGKKVIFYLGQTYDCRRIRLEFTQIASDVKYASASELIFLKPEEEAVGAVRSAFADYNMFTFTQSFAENAAENISTAKRTAAYAYSEEVKLLADRAAQVLGGGVAYNSAFEFSTADGADNPIVRAGNTAGYADNTLKMVWLGTNRQVTGVGAAAGETLTVFVDCEEGDPLPSIVFTQHIGNWNSWKSGAYTLSRGINFITVPNLYNSGWSTKTLPGGPVYIVNPYTEEQQSAGVKVYIEGGYSFPVYRAGDSDEEYLSSLESYLDSVKENPDSLPDLTEIVSDNVMLTVTASQALKQYTSGNYSPSRALENWKKYLNALYDFGGVFDKEHYDSRSQYLNVNIRVMQSLSGAAAYAINEYIGIYPGNSWEVTCLRGENFGWGVTHEIGHLMEISEREWGEYTNNMWSQYNKCALDGESARGNFAAFLAATVKDGVPYEERDAYLKHTSDALTWWVIESRYPGFWGRFENNYRYADRAGITDKAELHVYFASLAAGADLSYYFERIGFNWNGNDPFKGYAAASSQFKSAIDYALSSGKIKNNPLKLWYMDAEAYNYTAKYGKDLALYSDADKVNVSVWNTSSGTMLIMDDKSDFRHLGYEILRGNERDGYEVIGFTYGRSFTDTNPAEGQNYLVRAYDRALGCSAYSSPQNVSGAVARVDGQDYSTLAEAIEAAPAGGIVYLLSDAAADGIVINKNITLSPLGADVTIYLSAPSAMFTVSANTAFSIEAEGHTLTLDGLEIENGEALIVSDGTLSLSGGVVIQNAVNTSANGGAIRIHSGTLNVSGATFANNSASNGGAIVSQAAGNATLNISGATFAGNSANGSGGAIYANCIVNFSDTVFEGNTAADGGAVCINGGGIFAVSDCTFSKNTAMSRGGALYLDGLTTFGDGDTVFEGNMANLGGAIYVASRYSSRRVTISSAQFLSNTAAQGGAIYIGGYAALGAKDASLGIYGYGDGASSALYVAQGVNLSQGSGALVLDGGVCLYSPLTFGTDFTPEGSKIGGVFTLYGNQSAIVRFSGRPQGLDFRCFISKDGHVYSSELVEDAEGWAISASSERAYTVTVTDGESVSAQYYAAGESFVLPQATAPQGYTFRGWRCGGRLYAEGEEVLIVSDMTFTAEYELIVQDEPSEGGDDEVESEGEGDGDGVSMPAWVYAVIACAAVIVVTVAIGVGIYVHSKRKNK